MTGVGRPLAWGEIKAYLVEVGTELEARGLGRSLVVVGGAYVASRGVRASTTDVDTIDELDAELRAVLATVGEAPAPRREPIRVLTRTPGSE